MSDHKNVQRLPAEELYQRELEALISAERDPIPTGWRMSPKSVLTYLTGNTSVKGVEITPKYMGAVVWWRSPLPPWSQTGRCC